MAITAWVGCVLAGALPLQAGSVTSTPRVGEAAPAAEATPGFVLPDPSEPVAHLWAYGGLGARVWHLRLFSDGRVSEEYDHGDGHRRVRGVAIALVDLDPVVQSLVSQGLAEADMDDIRRRQAGPPEMDPLGRGPVLGPIVADGGTLVFELRLADWKGLGPIHQRLGLEYFSADSAAVELRAVAEFRSWAWEQLDASSWAVEEPQ